LEIDISRQVKRIVKAGTLGVIAVTVAASASVWFWLNNSGYVAVQAASVQGDNVNVSIKAGGTVAEILVADGAEVKAGDNLARLNVMVTPEEIAQLEDAAEKAKERYQQILKNPPVQQQVTTSGGNAAAQAAYDSALAEKSRMERLYAIGGVSRVQYESALAAFESAQRSLAAASAPVVQSLPINNEQMIKIAEIQVRQAEMALAAAKGKEQAAEIIAPVDGIVKLEEFAVGDEVQAGQALFSISSEKDSWVEAVIAPADKDKVMLGQFIEYEISDYRGEKFSGTLFEIADDEEAEAVKLKISLPLDEEKVFRPGMKVNLKIRSR
jgi:multidrug resistance efflux pump